MTAIRAHAASTILAPTRPVAAVATPAEAPDRCVLLARVSLLMSGRPRTPENVAAMAAHFRSRENQP